MATRFRVVGSARFRARDTIVFKGEVVENIQRGIVGNGDQGASAGYDEIGFD